MIGGEMKERNWPYTRAVVAFSMLAFTSFVPCLSVPGARSLTDIRQVDFLNFANVSSCADGSRTVRNGSFLSDTQDSKLYIEVFDVKYGDLTGDGKEEAVVLTVCSGGGTGSFTEGYLYTLRNGAPALVAQLEGGDRAYGSIRRVKIANGFIEVIRNDGGEGGACCPEFVANTKYRLMRSRLVPIGRQVRAKIGSNNDPSRERIKFDKGRTTAILKGSAIRGAEYIIGAQAGQSLILHLSSDRGNAKLHVRDTNEQDLAGSSTNVSFNGRLPATGDYVIVVQATSGITNYVLEVTIPARGAR
jgi:hypothetical protein